MPIDNSFSPSGQIQAINWLYTYLKSPQKASEARQMTQPKAVGEGREHSRALRLQVGAIRHLRLLRHILHELCPKKIRPRLESLMLLALFELLDDLRMKKTNTGAIIHSWVDTGKTILSKQEARFINAVLRKGYLSLANIMEGKTSVDVAIRHSHPDWLVKRWQENWGDEETLSFLQWNQSTPSIYLRKNRNFTDEIPDSLEKTEWTDFYRLRRTFPTEILPWLQEGKLTVQDPATRVAVDTLVRQPVSTVLELCASPGGKARALDALLPASVELTMVDLPQRLDLLRQNLSYSKRNISFVGMDLLNPDGHSTSWNNQFGAILLDAPCSNTGVLQRKPDVKWRLQPEDMPRLRTIQSTLLENAAKWLAPGGFLVYSTCSVEEEENGERVASFMSSENGGSFSVVSSTLLLPHQTGHDGVGVTVLRKKPA